MTRPPAPRPRQCQACGESFIFSAEQRAWFESRGMLHAPGHCPRCLFVRRELRGLLDRLAHDVARLIRDGPPAE